MNILTRLKNRLLGYNQNSKKDNNILVLGENTKISNSSFGGKNRVDSNVECLQAKIGYATTIARDCVLRGSLKVGNYCQFGPGAKVFTKDHPWEHASIYVNKVFLEGRQKRLQPSAEVVIGNDVWIGANAVILKGVTIGDGAVVAAGAIVNKNVPEYSIVAGSPAKEIRKRFDDEVIQLLKELEWWTLTTDEIEKISSLFEFNLNDNKDLSCEEIKKSIQLKQKIIKGQLESG